jgi:hypothetical protein
MSFVNPNPLEYAVGAVTFIAMMMYGLLTKNVDLSKNYLIAMATIEILPP